MDNRLKPFSIFLGVLVIFSTVAKGAHDIWAATLVYLISLSFALFLLFRLCWGPKSKGIRLPPLLPVLCVLCAFLLSYKGSIHPWESYYELMDWVISLLLCFVAIQVFHSESTLRPFLFFMVGLIGIEWVANIAGFMQDPNPLSFRRQSGTLVNANIAAGFFLFWIPVFWHQLQGSLKENSKSRWIWGFGLGALLINLLFTRSAAAWICLLVFLPFVFGIKNVGSFAKKRPGLFWLSLGLIIGVVGGLLWGKMIELYGFGGRPTAPGATSRVLWWKSGWQMFLDHPWFGVGLGNFQHAYLAYKIGGGQHTLFAHSWLIGLLAETGIIGTLAVLYLGVSWLKQVGKRANPTFLGLVLFLLFSSFNLGFEYFINLMIFFLFFAISIRPTLKRVWKPRRSLQILMAALAIASFPYILSSFMASQQVEHAKSLIKENKLESAIQYFQSATTLDAKNSEAFRGWARASFLKFEKGKSGI